MKLAYLTLTILTLVSCSIFKHNKTTETMWINGYQKDCIGVGPQKCFLVQHGDTLTEDWKNFYDRVEGFDFEPGYIYELEVNKTILPPNEVPADASNIRYTLVKIKSKERDPKFILHDIYVVTNINGYGELKDLSKAPTFEINLTDARIGGKDGCNTYGASIEKLTNTDIQFGVAFATKMYCTPMDIADAFQKALPQVQHYQRKGMFLYLMDKNRKVVLTLKKVD